MPVADTTMKRIDTVINWVTLLVVILLGLLAWRFGAMIWNLFRSSTEFESFAVSRVEGFDASDQLVTSIAGVDMLWITYPENASTEYSLVQILDRDVSAGPGMSASGAATYEKNGRELLAAMFPPLPNQDDKVGAFGYCVHSYELAFGYPSLADFQNSLDRQVADLPDDVDIATRIDTLRIPNPEILALHILNTQLQPPINTDDCMRKNESGKRRTALEEELWAVLEHDRVKQVHIKQAQFAAVTLVDAIRDGCSAGQADDSGAKATESQGSERKLCWRKLLTRSWQRSAEQVQISERQLSELIAQAAWLRQQSTLGADALAALPNVGVMATDIEPKAIENFDAAGIDATVQQISTRVDTLNAELQAFAGEESALFADAAGLGAVQVTISTLFGMDTAWRPWYWKDQEGVYLQRDVTNIVYGSSVAPTAIRPPASDPVNRIGLVRLKAPAILSRDRRTSFVLQTGSPTAWTKGTEGNVEGNIGAFVTDSINGSVDNVERRIRRRAIDSAEALLRQRVANWFRGGVQIEFENGEEPLLMDLRNWFDEQGLGETR